MPLPIYTSAAFTNGSGVSVASNASVEVRRESDGSLVPIFEDRDGQNQITQPGFQADLEGRFEFYAEPAAEGWEITVTAGPDTHTLNSQFPQGGVFGIPEGERAINSEELLAAVSEAEDIDEAVSFVGRGAIVESGTNSNGSYVRWENGEQVTFQVSPVFSGAGSGSNDIFDQSTPYPASFTVLVSKTPGGLHRLDGNHAFAVDSWPFDVDFDPTRGSTTGRIRAWGVSVTADLQASLTTWGKWK